MLTEANVQADAERVMERAEAAGHWCSPLLYCAFFQAAAAAAHSHKQHHALDARERVLARLERLEGLCRSAPHTSDPAQPLSNLQQSLTSLAHTVRAYVENGFASRVGKARVQTGARVSCSSRSAARGTPCNALLTAAPGTHLVAAAGDGSGGAGGGKGAGVRGRGGNVVAKSRRKASATGAARSRKVV